MSNPMPGQPSGMIDRIKAILTKPKETWPVIAAEPATPGELMMRWAVPLAAIRPMCEFLHGQLFGYGAFGFSYKPSLVGGLSSAIATYILALVAVVLVALIVDWLAPRFDGVADRTNAFKLVVYGSTAGWIAGLFFLIPGLSVLALLGLYSLYLYYTGATPLMKVPEPKAGGFTAVTIVVALVLAIVVAPVAALITGAVGLGATSSLAANGGTVSGKLTIPGVGTVDTDRMNAATKQIEGVANGTQQPASGSALQALLPGSIGAYQRTAVESTAIGKMGSNAEGTYTAGDNSFRLKVTDMAAIGALAGLGAAMGVEQNREDANGYEHTGTVDGQMQSEKWNKTDSSGSFGRMVGGRFMIEAEGKAASIDELKAAVATVDQGKLAALAK